MKETKNKSERKYLPTLADLIDALTIDQIKEIKFNNKKSIYAEGIKKICHDIDLIINERDIKINSKIMRLIIILAQLNIYIWENKDKMQKEDSDSYLKLLKISHQLNGIRNTMKNKISEEIGDKDLSKKKTNIEIDDLKGWDISID